MEPCRCQVRVGERLRSDPESELFVVTLNFNLSFTSTDYVEERLSELSNFKNVHMGLFVLEDVSGTLVASRLTATRIGGVKRASLQGSSWPSAHAPRMYTSILEEFGHLDMDTSALVHVRIYGWRLFCKAGVR